MKQPARGIPKDGPARTAGDSAPRIGLALSAGGARGVAHVLAFEALDELGLKPAIIAGTSIGAVLGVAYASGMTGAEIRDYMLSMFRHRGEVLARLWRVRSPSRFTGILAPTLANPAQLNAERFLAAFLPDAVPRRFDELQIPFVAVASDFYGWRAVGLREGELLHAVAASMALPMMFRPLMVDGRVMVDGGVTDPLPCGFVGADSDVVVAFDVVNGPSGDPGRIPSPYESVFGATQLLMQTVVAGKVASTPPDILIRPNLAIFRVLDFLKVRAILKLADPTKDALKRQLEAVLEHA